MKVTSTRNLVAAALCCLLMRGLAAGWISVISSSVSRLLSDGMRIKPFPEIFGEHDVAPTLVHLYDQK
jgi:hypothetical protein